MSNTVARRLALTLMHAGFLLSSIINVMAVSPKLDCTRPGCLLAGHLQSLMPVKANAGAGASSSNLSADDWGYWHPLGNGVSVRFKIVQRNYERGYHLWTWEFKNDSYSSKVTYLKF
jgi:hypothetical protein